MPQLEAPQVAHEAQSSADKGRCTFNFYTFYYKDCGPDVLIGTKLPPPSGWSWETPFALGGLNIKKNALETGGRHDLSWNQPLTLV